jgi:hypothetical protein
MSKRRRLPGWLFGVLLLGGCVPMGPGDGSPAEELSFEFDFQAGAALDWQADVTDFPPDQEGNLQFEAQMRSLPAELGVNGTGFYVQSFNTPDDLFTYIKRELGAADGIVPGQAYNVTYEIRFASNAPTGCFGVGGSPGESVYLKAGAAASEPLPVLSADGQRFELSVDKGDQATGGAAASVVSTIENGTPCEEVPNLELAPYVSLLRNHVPAEEVTASDTGELWLLIGVDSGFESLTGLYYQTIEVTLEPVD